MSNIDVIRAWKDEAYRNSLSPEQRALIPENPAGLLELDDQALEASVGGASEVLWSLFCCGGLTQYYTCAQFTVCGVICTGWGAGTVIGCC